MYLISFVGLRTPTLQRAKSSLSRWRTWRGFWQSSSWRSKRSGTFCSGPKINSPSCKTPVGSCCGQKAFGRNWAVKKWVWMWLLQSSCWRNIRTCWKKLGLRKKGREILFGWAEWGDMTTVLWRWNMSIVYINCVWKWCWEFIQMLLKLSVKRTLQNTKSS